MYYEALSYGLVRLPHETAVLTKSLSAVCPCCYCIVGVWPIGMVRSDSRQANYENRILKAGDRSFIVHISTRTGKSSPHTVDVLWSRDGDIQISVAGTQISVVWRADPDAGCAFRAAFHDSLPRRPCG